MSSPTERSGPIWRRGLPAIVAFVLSLCLAEGLARWLLPDWRPGGGERLEFWSYHETLGWAHEPSSRGRFAGPHWDVEVTINDKGLRDVEHDYQRSLTPRMLLLGDSYGWGYGVEQGQGVAAQLRDRCPGRELINAAVSGYGTDQQSLYFALEGHRYAPDSVLILTYPNDIVENSCASMYGYPKPRFVHRGDGLALDNVPVPERTFVSKLYRGLSSRSYLLSRLLHVTGLGNRLNLGCEDFDPLITQKLLTRFAQELRSAGIELKLALIPDRPGKVSRHEGFYHKLAEKEEADFLDLGPALAAAVEGGKALTLPGDSHWNAAGHRVAAEALADWLECREAQAGDLL